MDIQFNSYLDTAGVTAETKKVLLEQGIVSKMVFSSLREEHFERLLPSVTLGQHALLLKVWDCSTQWRSGLHEVRISIA